MTKFYTTLFIVVASLAPNLLSAQLSNISEITLTFIPTSGSSVTATATDSGNGLTVDGPIMLLESTDYTLSIGLSDGMSNTTQEIIDNGNDFQFFFETSDEIFAAAADYNDVDGNGLPIGLSTNWTTACVDSEDLMGNLRVTLNDLGDQKSASSTIADGTQELDLTWEVMVMDDADAPECENEEEVIDRVTLTFTPTAGGDPVVAVAIDPDGPGPMDLQPEAITLMESTDYDLSITLENTIEGEDITEEIMEEDDEHLFLFAFDEDLFESPDGDGNIDNRADPINYLDSDDDNLPVGLSTAWTTACTTDDDATGTFRVVLKHQPGVKSPTSGFEDGGTDIDIPWNITIMDDADAPECENEEEVIDRVTLTFTPTAGGDPVVAVAIDPDGPGPMDLQPEAITLMESTDYDLSITLENTIEGEDITEEIMEEDDEHLFLFAFDEDLFESPNGDGNVDNRTDPINYLDSDDDNLPVGLRTAWTTACTTDDNATGTFRVVLKHQPGVKSPTSGFEDGGTDIDIPWNITIMDDADAPECENEEEVIDRVTLTFTPMGGGGDPIVTVATDPDGPGPQDIEVENINLIENTTYDLAITVENTIEGEDITEEIREEDDEHQFFFGWTGDIFSDPTGNGNIDNSTDPVNYNDQDDNGLPLGLSTTWTTSAAMGSGTFRIALKHQPGIKSATSTFSDGGTDIDITWSINSVVTSLDNLTSGQSFVIAPNPVNDFLTIQTENVDLSETQAYIYNTLGTLVRSIQRPTSAIAVDELAPGTYVLVIEGERLRVTRRFLKVR